MIYWLLPRLFQTELWSKKLAEVHALLDRHRRHPALHRPDLRRRHHPGADVAGLRRDRRLLYPDFVETTTRLMPIYWVRVLGGAALPHRRAALRRQHVMTWRRRGRRPTKPVHEAPRCRVRERVDPPPSPLAQLAPVTDFRHKLDALLRSRVAPQLGAAAADLHGDGVTVAVVVASLFEIIPTFLIKSNVPTIATVKPYTPLELAGRDIYVAEGCYNCHSQMIRPIRAETERYGEYSKPGRVRLRPSVPVGLAPHRPRSAPCRRQVPEYLGTSVTWSRTGNRRRRRLDHAGLPWMLRRAARLRGDPGRVSCDAHARRPVRRCARSTGRSPTPGDRRRRSPTGRRAGWPARI